MAKTLIITGATALARRKELGINQSDFWNRYGVTQSGGSRFESGRKLPKSVRMLMAIEEGKASLADLSSGKLAVLV
jgi:predicted transcriptional regulator